MSTQNLVKFCPFILTILNRKQNSDISRALTLLQICKKIISNNPNLDIVNVNLYTKFGSQEIERKCNSEFLTPIKGPNSVANLQKNDR